MVINIFYICTGEYKRFFDKFYLSCEDKFIPEFEKKYYVFTDSDRIYFRKYLNVEVINVEKNCWPLNTLLRFSYFLKVIDKLQTNSYTFFFNANAVIVKEIPFSTFMESDLIGVIHPGYKNRISILYPWERRKNATCYLGYLKKGIYYQGCFNGGKTASFKRLIQICNMMTMADLKKNLIAKVHDESYLNYYYYYNKPLLLSELYSWPEKYGENKDAKIIMRDKERESWYGNIKK